MILINHGPAAFVVERGMRIAQMVIAAVPQATFTPVEILPSSERGAGGFGSTGHGSDSVDDGARNTAEG